jgi:hypothetical protein
MKIIHKHLLLTDKHIKILILIGLTLITATLNTHAQNSGFQIATSGEVTIMRDGEVRINGITPNTASLRKTVVSNAVNNFNQLTPAQLQNPIGSTKQSTAKETTSKEIVAAETTVKETSETVPATAVKQAKPINVLVDPATTITSATIYDIPGTTSIPSRQYTSLQAGFKFTYYDRNRTTQSPAGIIELYKLEKGTNIRSFCIPSGGCASVNIPIQITANGQPVVADAGGNAGAGGGTGKSPLYLVVLPNGGYLQPGEYAFIDKSSLYLNGSALVCFTFTVRQ